MSPDQGGSVTARDIDPGDRLMLRRASRTGGRLHVILRRDGREFNRKLRFCWFRGRRVSEDSAGFEIHSPDVAQFSSAVDAGGEAFDVIKASARASSWVRQIFLAVRSVFSVEKTPSITELPGGLPARLFEQVIPLSDRSR